MLKPAFGLDGELRQAMRCPVSEGVNLAAERFINGRWRNSELAERPGAGFAQQWNLGIGFWLTQCDCGLSSTYQLQY